MKRIRDREEMQRLHEQEMHFKKLRQQAEKEEEEQFKKEVRLLGFYFSLQALSLTILCPSLADVGQVCRG